VRSRKPIVESRLDTKYMRECNIFRLRKGSTILYTKTKHMNLRWILLCVESLLTHVKSCVQCVYAQ